VTDPDQVLADVQVVLVVDWPSRDVPDTLLRGGFRVVVHGGPGPEDYSSYELQDGEIVVRPPGPAPERADLVYAHRPLDDLPGIVTMAQRLGAQTIWYQSGVDTTGARDASGCFMFEQESLMAREIVESAGMDYRDQPYIGDVIRMRDAGA
jgi:predicted CoA-binding protein